MSLFKSFKKAVFIFLALMGVVAFLWGYVALATYITITYGFYGLTPLVVVAVFLIIWMNIHISSSLKGDDFE